MGDGGQRKWIKGQFELNIIFYIYKYIQHLFFILYWMSNMSLCHWILYVCSHIYVNVLFFNVTNQNSISLIHLNLNNMYTYRKVCNIYIVLNIYINIYIFTEYFKIFNNMFATHFFKCRFSVWELCMIQAANFSTTILLLSNYTS